MDRRNLLTGMAASGVALSINTSPSQAAESSGTGENSPVLSYGGGNGRPELKIKWAFSVSVFFKERIVIQSPYRRAFVPALGGEVWGPRLNGIVVPYGGADFGGGGGPLDAHYMFEADDGSLLYINNRAYMKALGEAREIPSAEVRDGESFSQRMGGTALAGVPLRMRTTPFFDVPKDSPHAWMSSTLFIGHGARNVNPDHTLFTYYEVL